jgi:hypothetical protein
MCAYTEHITKTELLAKIENHRALLEESLEKVSLDQMTSPGIGNSDWTIKDILAHLVSWEQIMIKWVTQAMKDEVPKVPQNEEDVDTMNANFYYANKDKALDLVLEEFTSSYKQALKITESIPEDILLTPDRFAWRKNPLWHMVASNTWWHYDEHREDIDNWANK